MNTATSPTATPWQRVVDAPCALGESPFWHPKEQRLYWVDIALKRLWRLHVPSNHLEYWDLPQEPGSIAPCRSGALLIAMRDGIYQSFTWHDIPQKVANAPYDSSRIRFNDGKCDAWGRFWVGTAVDARDRPDGALYCLHQMSGAHPKLHMVESGVMVSNGLAWSPDGRTMYWADTSRHNIFRYDLSQPGQWPPQLGPVNPLARFTPKPADWTFEQALGKDYGGRPDGAAVDSAGRYWVAMYEGARVLCLSPKGDLVAEYPTPAQCPTMVCFGGSDLRTLYLTTARQKRSSAELAHYPDSGAVFSMRVDTPGLPVNFYWD
jgi:sugar lactone lactonase YvrE